MSVVCQRTLQKWEKPTFHLFSLLCFSQNVYSIPVQGSVPLVMSQSNPSPSPFAMEGESCGLPPNSTSKYMEGPKKHHSDQGAAAWLGYFFFQEATNRWFNLVTCGLSVLQGGFTGAWCEKLKFRLWVRNGTFNGDKKKSYCFMWTATVTCHGGVWQGD